MRRLVIAGLVLALGAPAVGRAQYFGQNKVHYRRFDFRVLRTEHFEVYYYPREREAAVDAARMAERAYARLSRMLQHEWRERKPLILYSSQADFQQTNVVAGELGEGTGGVTEFFKHRMVLPFTGSYADFEHVLQHEMVHAFQYDVLSRGRPGAGLETITRVNPPLWFMEGMAEYLSIGPVNPHTAMWLRDAALEGELPTIEELTYNPRIFPYRFGHAIWAYIGEKWGDEVIGQILQGAMSGGIERAFQRALGLSLEQLSDEWRDAVQTTYLPQLAQHQRARRFARPLLNRKRSKGTLHVAPQISPDGREVIYLSERDFYFVDLYLASAETGRVRRKLVASSFDPDFESLRFINSAGSWSPDGRHFALAAKSGAQDHLVILDVQRRRVAAHHRLDLDAIANPSWSPDGQQLVFTGFRGGLSDLYVVGADGRNLRRLTQDRYADLMPAWSPDGRTIALATDRGAGTDFSILRFGNLRIALYHLDGDSIEILPGMETGKNINPVFSPDGGSLAFVSDRTGINNLFLFDGATREVYQLTDAYTGVSGITDLSPAISWARQADRMLLTVYEEGEYNVYAIDNPRSLRRSPYRAPAVPPTAVASVAPALPSPSDSAPGVAAPAPVALAAPAAAAPQPPRAPAPERPSAIPAAGAPGPAERPGAAGARPPAAALAGELASVYRGGEGFRPSDASPGARDAHAPLSVAALLDSAAFALPDTAEFDDQPYRVRFTPDFVSRPQIGYVRDNFGRGFFGGSAIQLSDVLGDRMLIISGAVNGRLEEAQVFAAYLNLSRRWNYALGLSQEPIFYYGSSDELSIEGSYLILRQRLLRIVQRQVFGEVFYPLNRFRRVEAGVRLASLSLDTLLLSTFADPGSRAVLGQESEVVSGSGLSYVQPSLALVYDNSLFGYTGPIYGHRYRMEVAPSFGDWRFTQVLADYRRYDAVLRPFTLATRLLAFGRLGRDGDQFPLFLGSPDLVRGYTFRSFTGRECVTNATGTRTGCSEVDQLIGSRVIVANAELRFPLVRSLTLGFLPVGFPPIEAALFYDAGLAWNQSSVVALSRRDGENPFLVRVPVTSYGVGARIILLGIAIVRVDYAVPRQRPLKGGYWIVSVGPTF